MPPWAAQEPAGDVLRFHGMPSAHHQTLEWNRLSAPAAPVLTREGFCSVCRAPPMSICGDEVHICRSCLAVLWHLERRATAKPVTHKPLAGGKPPVPKPWI
jgi:hypothetical protein